MGQAGARATSLTAPHSLKYTYKRSCGPVLGRFFGALRERTILGVRRKDGSVLVPPKEYDPDTGEALSELVRVGDAGAVTSWAWVARPREKQPVGRPFAYALIRLDGADTPLLHAVDAGSEARMRTGMRVRARWAPERTGSIRDIEAFEPDEARPPQAGAQRAASEARSEGGARAEFARAGERSAELVPREAARPVDPTSLPEPVETLRVPVSLDYTFSAGQAATRFLRAIAEGRLVGQRCPVDGKVYFPTRGACPEHGVPTEGEMVEIADRGTIVSYSIVRVPSENLQVEVPFAAINVLLDGADTTFTHVLSECRLEDVHMGMRVQAVWTPREEWTTSMRNIKYWRPSGEPDAPFSSYEDHL
jgi:hypothetical protein